uniref:Zinc finger protein 526 n=1 Tax=Neogobius melanostomus TaxID=47308 RepID=A0A8C6WJJ8_9GOBI
MAEQQDEAEDVYVEHQFMCSECHQLFNTLEDVLVHQQIHTASEGEEGIGAVNAMIAQGIPEVGHDQQYQCLECGTLLVNSDELLQHQEMHMREVGAEMEQGIFLQIHYQCLDCLALFNSPETWLEHRHTHSRSSTEMVLLSHPYECSECSLLFNTPEDFLQHQGEHFLAQDKESEETGVVSIFDDARVREDSAEKATEIRLSIKEKKTSSVWSTPQQCDLCPRTFTTASRLACHRRVHEQGTFECSECGKIFKRAMSLETHMRSHTGVARFLCVDCGQGFATELTLITHRKAHTADPFYKCTFCNKVFTSMTKQLYHRRIHLNHDASAPAEQPSPEVNADEMGSTEFPAVSTDNSTFSCRSCAKTFSSQKQLVIHRRKAHAAECSFMCGICGKSFKKQIHVNNHIRTHTGERPYQSNLIRHNLIHSGVRPYRCEVCNRSFSQSSNLRNHSMLHSRFVSSSGVALHQRVHTGERPYPCQVCGKRFRQNTHLREHLRTHSGERPFHCELCGKNFIQSMHLAEHRRTHTGERPHTQGTPTIMCNEFGETIAIIETSEGSALPLEQALEIYQTALENGLGLDSPTVERMQLL